MNSLIGRSNKDLDVVDDIIIVPNKEDVKLHQDAEQFIIRLDEIESPSQRLFTMAKSCFHLVDEPTHEARAIRKMFFAGVIGGLFYGAILSTGEVTAKYIRNYNAAVFDNQYRAKRMYYDNLIGGLFARGCKYAFKNGLLVGSAGFIAFGSITYRGKLYLPDWLISFATLGGLTRLWLGGRAVAVGGLMGSLAGLTGFGLAKAAEAFTGYSVSQIKYLEHTEWLERRNRKRLRLLAAQEERFKSFQDEG